MFGYVLHGKGDVDIRAVIPPPRRLRRGGLREHHPVREWGSIMPRTPFREGAGHYGAQVEIERNNLI